MALIADLSFKINIFNVVIVIDLIKNRVTLDDGVLYHKLRWRRPGVVNKSPVCTCTAVV